MTKNTKTSKTETFFIVLFALVLGTLIDFGASALTVWGLSHIFPVEVTVKSILITMAVHAGLIFIKSFLKVMVQMHNESKRKA